VKILDFNERLKNSILIADGAMGSLLHESVGAQRCFDELNHTEPEAVFRVHQAYIEAGAQIIETNTFGANRFKLAAFGLDAEVRRINTQGARVARDARESSGRDVFVLGSIGPLGRYLVPVGTVTPDEARAAFREQAEALVEGGVDALIAETFADLTEITLAIEAIRSVADLPIVAQLSFTEECLTFTGRTAAEVARTLRELGVQAMGANCSVGSSILYEVLEQMLPEAGAIPLAIQPNAGLPAQIGQRLIYISSPAYMAEYAGRMLEVGATIVGGCCGTTPSHIAAMREVVDRRLATPRRTARPPRVAPRESRSVADAAAPRESTPLQRKLEAREFVVTVELDPPRGHAVDKLVQGAKLLKERGVEIVDINDGSLGRVRMAVLPTALLIREATGLDVSMHFTCRDRNLMSIQAELLAAQALDIRNILAMTGDPPRTGDYVNTTAVFDVDAVGLLEVIRRLNEGLDATGTSIGSSTAFCAGAVLNPAPTEVGREIERVHRKIEAGARWLQTQPVYDLEQFERFVAQCGTLPVPLVVGVLPLHSFRHAEFLHNEVPGITIPDRIRTRLREAGDGALRVGIEMGQELVLGIRARFPGVYLMPSFGRFEVVAEVLDALR
jgi:methionine synthase / methylenetetrahydrofolate reductase (NADH)